MPEAKNAIETRQQTERLFVINEPIDAGDTVELGPKTVAGFGVVTFLGISDQPFTITVQEANEADGEFVTVATIPSALVSSKQVARGRVDPCGYFMKILVNNPGGTDQDGMDLVGLGLPIGT